MNKGNLQLPPKSHFSLEEVAQRWGTDIETIRHYIWESGDLRAAILEDELVNVCSVRSKKGSSNFQYITTSGVIQDRPKYLYLNKKSNNPYLNNPDAAQITEQITAYITEHQISEDHDHHVYINTKWADYDKKHLFRCSIETKDKKTCYILATYKLDDDNTYQLQPRTGDLFYPLEIDGRSNFVITLDEIEQFEKSHSTSSTKLPAAKTTNMHLRIIRALSEALIGKLAGSHEKNADAILLALDLKGIESPVKQRALKNYLADSDDL